MNTSKEPEFTFESFTESILHKYGPVHMWWEYVSKQRSSQMNSEDYFNLKKKYWWDRFNDWIKSRDMSIREWRDSVYWMYYLE